METRQGKVYYPCSVCGKTYEYVKSKQKHEKTCGKRLKCLFCEKTFKNKDTRQKHKCAVHCKQSCAYEDCDATFNSEKQLSQHIKRIHEKKFECPSCEKVFKTSGCLRTHKYKKHNQDKNPPSKEKEKRVIYCKSCPKTYSSTQGLRKHVKLVHNEP